MSQRLNSFLVLSVLVSLFVLSTLEAQSYALNGGPLRVKPRNGWKAFEVISTGDNPAGDGQNWTMPTTFDGLGAQLVGSDTLRVQVNHEIGDATISQVDLNLGSLLDAISNTIVGGTPDVNFVNSAQQAYSRWSNDAGQTWTNTTGVSNTNFNRFCSGQSYLPNTFGADRGFVDNVYVTGEESFGASGFNRLFALDLDNRDFYQLSGVSGSAAGGLGGMPFDSWENAALVDTGETDHVALLLSPDGGTQSMQIYIGEKGKDPNGNASSDFLARNGLAYGSYYYLNDFLPGSGTSTNGTFDTTISGSLNSSKLEDVDTSPSEPTRVVLGDQDSGLFTFDFDLDFSGGSFSAGTSGFSLTKTQNHVNNTVDSFGDADNVEWTEPTEIGGKQYPEGVIFVNEDTNNGEIWMTTPLGLTDPNGNVLIKIGDTVGLSAATETSGILDISGLLGFTPGNVLLTSNQSTSGTLASSLSVLINPDLSAGSADFDGDGLVTGLDFLTWQEGATDASASGQSEGDANINGAIGSTDLAIWAAQYGGAPETPVLASVPEPSIAWLLLTSSLVWLRFRRKTSCH